MIYFLTILTWISEFLLFSQIQNDLLEIFVHFSQIHFTSSPMRTCKQKTLCRRIYWHAHKETPSFMHNTEALWDSTFVFLQKETKRRGGAAGGSGRALQCVSLHTSVGCWCDAAVRGIYYSNNTVRGKYVAESGFQESDRREKSKRDLPGASGFVYWQREEIEKVRR